MSYPDAKPAKFIHIVGYRHAGLDLTIALCGRRVNWSRTGAEEQATCTKCVAESLARAVVRVEG